ncbi:hypothetical protein EK904_004094 [Melospiza melodia maxima]|nr:hypothetical protein EK904_004094 [Melospiza melodia maxima]
MATETSMAKKKIPLYIKLARVRLSSASTKVSRVWTMVNYAPLATKVATAAK